ncbi:MAG: HEAT repeat domain-containing protein [Planctomycetaceae bacterium]|jgi:hypothetical protein|nr:HEAT repeat domain-containing protein [Planctomycetaceae bacterium]
MLIAIFLIVISGGCRMRGNVGQNNIDSAIQNKFTTNLPKNNSPKITTADNQNWWPDEIPIPPEATITSQNTKNHITQNSQQKIIRPKTPITITSSTTASTAATTTATTNDNIAASNKYENDSIVPPRQLEAFSIEPKPLAENINTTQNQKNSHANKSKQITKTNENIIKTTALNEINEKQQNKTNHNPEISLQDFETILTQAKWQPNIQLEHWTNNETKKSDNKSQSRERREQIKNLNLSEKEKTKLAKDKKYIDELISTWRWYNNEIDELVKKQLKPDIKSRPVLPVDPKIFLENNAYKNSKYNSLRSNAAILMGRCNDYDAVETLLEIIKNEPQDAIRCAAVETLGTMEHVNFEILIPLLEFARKRNNVTKNQPDNNHNNNRNNNSKNDEKLNASNRTNQITVVNKVLWSELLIALANKIEPWEHPCFLDALATDNVEVRRTCAKLWRQRSHDFWMRRNVAANYRNEKENGDQLQRLPARFLVFARAENDLPARIDMITTLGIWREPEILNIVNGDLNNANIRLRFAAIDAIAAADCKDAERILKDKLRDISVKTRAKSAEALCKLGFVNDVLRLAEDKEREVRIEVAKAVALAPSRQTATLAQRYIENDSEDVKLAALNSIAQWDRIDLSGDILIEALQSRSAKVQNLSAEILSQFCPDATKLLSKNFIADKERIKIVTNIKRQLNEYIQANADDFAQIIVTNNTNNTSENRSKATKVKLNEAEIEDVLELVGYLRSSGLTIYRREAIKRRLSEYGGRLLDILEYLYENYDDFEAPELVDEILAENNEIFNLILLLDSDSETVRRKSASELLRRSKFEFWGNFVNLRILECGLREADALMLSMYLGVLRNADVYKARYLAAVILQAERITAVELRKVACNVFGELGAGHDLIIVAQNLGDPRREVSHAAFEAIIKILQRMNDDEFEKERITAAEKLWEKFLAADLFSQVEISAAIYMLGEDAGAKSFIRLSFSPDARIKSHVVNVIGILQNEDFMSILIRYLDDKDANVSQAALAMLPKIAKNDIGIIETEIPLQHELSQTQKKIARWKKWFAN